MGHLCVTYGKKILVVHILLLIIITIYLFIIIFIIITVPNTNLSHDATAAGSTHIT